MYGGACLIAYFVGTIMTFYVLSFGLAVLELEFSGYCYLIVLLWRANIVFWLGFFGWCGWERDSGVYSE